MSAVNYGGSSGSSRSFNCCAAWSWAFSWIAWATREK